MMAEYKRRRIDLEPDEPLYLGDAVITWLSIILLIFVIGYVW